MWIVGKTSQVLDIDVSSCFSIKQISSMCARNPQSGHLFRPLCHNISVLFQFLCKTVHSNQKLAVDPNSFCRACQESLVLFQYLEPQPSVQNKNSCQIDSLCDTVILFPWLLVLVTVKNPDCFHPHRIYLKYGSPVKMMESYIAVLTKGICQSEENGSFLSKDFDARKAYLAGSIKG